MEKRNQELRKLSETEIKKLDFKNDFTKVIIDLSNEISQEITSTEMLKKVLLKKINSENKNVTQDLLLLAYKILDSLDEEKSMLPQNNKIELLLSDKCKCHDGGASEHWPSYAFCSGTTCVCAVCH